MTAVLDGVPAEGGPRVGVIHATTLSLGPMADALAAEFPSARVRHLLDDSLLPDLRAAGHLTPALDGRMRRLVAHLLVDGVDAVQLACSGYAATVDRLRRELSVPVCKPDDAMLTAVAAAGHRRVGIAATYPHAADVAAAGLRRAVADRGSAPGNVPPEFLSACRAEAMEAAQTGDGARLAAVVTDMARALVADGADAVVLAQFSLSPAAAAADAAVDVPVYSGPRSAARALATQLAATATDAEREVPRRS